MIKEGCFVSKSVNGFQPGPVLTHQLLKTCYDFPRELASIIYSEYDNCVISGLEYLADEGEVFLLPGVVRFKGDLYFLNNKISLTKLWNDYKQESKTPGGTGTVYFLIQKNSQMNADGCCKQTLGIRLSKEYDSKESIVVGALQAAIDKLELPDFTSPKRIYSRSHLLTLDVPYLGANGVGFHPFINRFLKAIIEQKHQKDYFDYALWMNLCGHKSVDIDVLKVYLKSKSVSVPSNDNSFRKNIIKEVIEIIEEDVVVGQMLTGDSSDEDEYESVLIEDR